MKPISFNMKQFLDQHFLFLLLDQKSELLSVFCWTEQTQANTMDANYLSRINRYRDQDMFGFEEHHHHIWPARNYACSFCKREFRSAQALGGHMNVHRRDRAKLRSALPSSWVDSECLKPNPSSSAMPNSTILSSSPLSDKLLNYTQHSPLCSPCPTSSPPSLASTSDDKNFPLLKSFQIPLPMSPQSLEMKMEKSTRSSLGIKKLKEFSAEEDEQKAFKNNESNIKLELGIGLLKHPKENLDLELRLGHF